MIKKAFYIAILVMAFAVNVKGQVVTYTNLSKKYIYKINFIRSTDTDGVASGKVHLHIYTRDHMLFQTINFASGVVFDGVFKSDTSCRSYITDKNKDAEVPDYDFGDFIVADLNFDGREDIAVKYDSGGNGGPFYNFYIQQADGTFKKDNYLTTYVGSFPEYINPKNKTIATQIHANVDQEARKTFKYNSQTQKWHLIKWILVNDL